MRNVLLTFALLLFAGLSFGQIKVISSGFTGIDQPNPTQKLHISNSGTGATGFLVDNGSNFVKAAAGAAGSAFFFNNATFFALSPGDDADDTTVDQANLFVVRGSGNVGVGNLNPSAKLDVNGNVQATSFDVASDRRLKKNVKGFEYGLAELMELNPVTYSYNGKGGTIDGDAHVGLIAQELQAAVPVLVTEYEHVEAADVSLDAPVEVKSSETYLQIRDNEVKYLLINAIKDQQAIITQLEDKIAQLETTVMNLSNGSAVQSVEVKDARLGQNAPNPFNQATTISYKVPTKAQTAVMQIFDMNGQLLKSVNVANGNGQLTLNAGELAAGTYSYNLVVDGKVVDTKKMVLTK